MTTEATTRSAHSNGDLDSALKKLSASMLLTKHEVASLLGIPPTSVQTLHESRQLRGVRVAKYMLWRACEVGFVEGMTYSLDYSSKLLFLHFGSGYTSDLNGGL